jgi:hypothetical protein
VLPTPPARPSRSGTVPAASRVPGAGAPDRLTVNLYAATLKRAAGPADHRSVHPFQRLLLPSAAFAALAIMIAALLPGRAAADFNGPLVRTDPATAVTDTTATLNGLLDANGRDTLYAFQYGTTTRYGGQTPTQGIDQHQKRAVSATVTGLTPGTVYHYRLVAQQAGRFGVFSGGDQTFTTAATPAAAPAPAAPAPAIPAATPPAALPAAAPVAALGTSVVVAPVKGTVLVKVPGAAGFVALGGANAQVPTGAILDTRKGQVALTTALDGGRTQTATFERGVFQVRQSKTGHGLTDIFLRGPAPACGTSRATGRAAAVTKRKPKKRQLWGRDKGGRFRTHGSNSVATVRGTSWITTDTCTGTRTTVKAGAVSVRDVHRHRTVLVRAGHSYLARRR